MGSLRLHAIAGLLILSGAAALRNCPSLAPGMLDWAEPGNVAAALAGGRGFSDPFDGGTGPTAWVSPLPAWIEAGVFQVLGVKTAASAAALLALAVAGLAAAHALLVHGLAPFGAPMRLGASAAFLAGCALLPGGPLEVQSEAWLDMLLAAALLWSALEASTRPGPRAAAALLAVAAAAPLENAGVAAALALVLAALAWGGRGRPGGLALPAAALALAALSVAGWTARNALVLGRPIPLKSNSWFELNLANVDSADGLPRMETVLRRLPYFDTGEFGRYRALGEVAYVDSFRRPALDALRRDPAHFAGNVLRWLAAAVVFCRRVGGGEATRFAFTAGDLGLLAASGELIPMGGAGALWTRIDTPIPYERLKLRALRLPDEEAVWGDWTRCRLEYDARFRSPGALLVGYLSAGVPVAALLLAALLTGGRPGPAPLGAALIAAGMLLPYVLVNHNDRHQLPILPLQAVAVGALCSAAAGRLRRSPLAP
jgi:hypothetical protein